MFNTMEQKFGSPWTPYALHLAGWWDASEIDTITEAGNFVSQWDDKSGNGNHLVQGNGAYQPRSGLEVINDKNAIRFDASLDNRMTAPNHPSLVLDATGGVNIFMALNFSGYINQGSGFNILLLKGTNWGANTYGINTQSFNWVQFASNEIVNTTVPPYNNQDIVISCTSNDTDPFTGVWVNSSPGNTRPAKTPSDNTGLLRVGGDAQLTRFTDMKVGEILILGGKLVDETRYKLEGYLAHKWGLAASLPGGHPYKTEAP
jgi:hypothetical protein